MVFADGTKETKERCGFNTSYMNTSSTSKRPWCGLLDVKQGRNMIMLYNQCMRDHYVVAGLGNLPNSPAPWALGNTEDEEMDKLALSALGTTGDEDIDNRLTPWALGKAGDEEMDDRVEPPALIK
uniref:Uncharacterized protein n=1 Tax=Ascaris lumbricoides TaxID=6252 RepID=A0A9J2PPH2_ASCLU